MLTPETEKYLDDIVGYVRFKYDRDAIRSELKDHIEDKKEDLLNELPEKFFDDFEAEAEAVKEMGNAAEIGKRLDKEHNFALGVLWRITKWAKVLLVVLTVGFVVYMCGMAAVDAISYRHYANSADAVFHVKTNQREVIDNAVFTITDIVYKKDGNLDIYYHHYNRALVIGGFNYFNHFTVFDGNGEEIGYSGGSGSGGFVSYGVATYSGFDGSRSNIKISYSAYDRNIEFVIPLTEAQE